MNIEKKISEVREKVHKNHGKTIFCFREFSCSTTDSDGGGFCPPPTADYKHYEAGIINGELNLNKKILLIDLPTKLLDQREDFYTLFGEFSVPVKRKLSGFLTLIKSFRFDKKDLENIYNGEIFFNRLELPPYSVLFNHHPILTDFSLLIGDDEVNNFFKEKKIISGQFFENLYHPEEIEKKIAIANYKEKENFGDELANVANKLILKFRQVKGIEKEVLGARYIVEADQDGVNRYWDTNKVFEYSRLKNSIKEIIPQINSQLEKGGAYYPSGTDLPLIKGHEIGFPGMVTFLAYKNWLDEKISEMKTTFNKIDNYLREGEKK